MGWGIPTFMTSYVCLLGSYLVTGCMTSAKFLLTGPRLLFWEGLARPGPVAVTMAGNDNVVQEENRAVPGTSSCTPGALAAASHGRAGTGQPAGGRDPGLWASPHIQPQFRLPPLHPPAGQQVTRGLLKQL